MLADNSAAFVILSKARFLRSGWVFGAMDLN